MPQLRPPNTLSVISLIAILVSIIGSASVIPVSGRFNAEMYVEAPTSGSGTAGTGSIAVASFFSGKDSSGLGAFSGSLMPLGIGGTNLDVAALWAVHSQDFLQPPLPPGSIDLGCGSAGEVELRGVVQSANNQAFSKNTVQLFGCVGLNVPDAVVFQGTTGVTYFGKGIGNVGVSSSPILAGAVFAGNTLGAGSAGSGSLDLGGQLVTTADNSLPSGGAFVGTLSGSGPVGGAFTVIRFSIDPGTFGNANETVIISGVGTSGSFSGQPVTITLTLTAVPTSSGPQPITVTVIVGSALNAVYAGHGSGLAAIAIPNLIEA